MWNIPLFECIFDFSNECKLILEIFLIEIFRFVWRNNLNFFFYTFEYTTHHCLAEKRFPPKQVSSHLKVLMRSLSDEPCSWLPSTKEASRRTEVMIVSFLKIPAGRRRVFKHLTSPIKKEESSNFSQVDYFCAARVGGAWKCSRTHNVFCFWREPVRARVWISLLVYVSAPLSHLPNATQLSRRTKM